MHYVKVTFHPPIYSFVTCTSIRVAWPSASDNGVHLRQGFTSWGHPRLLHILNWWLKRFPIILQRSLMTSRLLHILIGGCKKWLTVLDRPLTVLWTALMAGKLPAIRAVQRDCGTVWRTSGQPGERMDGTEGNKSIIIQTLNVWPIFFYTFWVSVPQELHAVARPHVWDRFVPVFGRLLLIWSIFTSVKRQRVCFHFHWFVWLTEKEMNGFQEIFWIGGKWYKEQS